jgi:heme exporter protein CcmD
MVGFFETGRYSAFVWSAYGLTVLGIGFAIASTVRAYRRAKERLKSFEGQQSR